MPEEYDVAGKVSLSKKGGDKPKPKPTPLPIPQIIVQVYTCAVVVVKITFKVTFTVTIGLTLLFSIPYDSDDPFLVRLYKRYDSLFKTLGISTTASFEPVFGYPTVVIGITQDEAEARALQSQMRNARVNYKHTVQQGRHVYYSGELPGKVMLKYWLHA